MPFALHQWWAQLTNKPDQDLWQRHLDLYQRDHFPASYDEEVWESDDLHPQIIYRSRAFCLMRAVEHPDARKVSPLFGWGGITKAG